MRVPFVITPRCNNMFSSLISEIVKFLNLGKRMVRNSCLNVFLLEEALNMHVIPSMFSGTLSNMVQKCTTSMFR